MKNVNKVFITKNTNRPKDYFRSNIRNISLLILIILAVVTFSLLSPYFFKLASLTNIISKSAVLFILSIGMSMVILTGGLDLSVGSNLALSSAVGVSILDRTGNPILAMILAVLAASSIGLINGLMIGKLKINSVIFTLAMLGMARSLTVVLLNSQTIKVKDTIFNWLGSYNIKTSIVNIPFSLFIITFLYILFFFIINYSSYGRRLKSIGGNIFASRAVGIMVEKNLIIVYVLTGLLVGIAGIVAVGRASSAAPLAGTGLEFESITAVIIGGASLKSGEIDLKGTFLGVLFLGIVFYGLSILNIIVYYIQLTQGILLLIVVIINHITQKYQLEY